MVTTWNLGWTTKQVLDHKNFTSHFSTLFTYELSLHFWLFIFHFILLTFSLTREHAMERNSLNIGMIKELQFSGLLLEEKRNITLLKGHIWDCGIQVTNLGKFWIFWHIPQFRQLHANLCNKMIAPFSRYVGNASDKFVVDNILTS